MKKSAKLITKLILVLLLTGTFTSCKKDNKNGEVSVKMTDDPFPMSMVSEANVGVTKVELKDENGNYVTVYEGNANVNMVNYTNGSTVEIGSHSVPDGTYSEARITLGDVSVRLTDNRNFDVSANAQHTYTVQVDPAIVIDNQENTDLLIDMDLSDSFSFTGTFGGWISNILDITGISHFNADFRAVDLSRTGTISGSVTNTNGTTQAYAEVSVSYDYDGDGQAESVNTIADANGNYAIIGLPEGSYNVTVTTGANSGATVNNNTVSVNHTTTVDITVN